MRRRLKAARTGLHGPITAGLALGHPRLNMYAVSEINNCELAPYDGRPHVADGGVGDGDAGVGRREGALERGGDPQGLGAQLRRVPQVGVLEGGTHAHHLIATRQSDNKETLEEHTLK